MQLTHGERLIIVMLAEVMEALSLNKEIDPALVKTLAIDNDGWALRRQYPGLFESSAPSDDVVKETTDILWMFGIIESSIDRLSGDEAEAAKGWHYGKWRGFDANNDPHYGVARTMIETLGEFADSRKDGIYVYFSPHQVCVRAQKANDNAEHAEMACVNLLSPN